ncbi:MAG: SPASM domain-containing protein [Chloroflexi bacterium]|nr:SPASM domain-containing protein [Chloroflexota bacterium]
MMVRARCAPQVARIASLRSSPLIGSAGCTAAKSYCRITPRGDVTPCPYLPLVAGNVREQPFHQIWQDAALFRRLREETPGGRCGGCAFKELCGGCRARTFALSGDLMREDPWCAYQPEETLQPMQAAILTWTPEAEARVQRIPSFIRERAKRAIERYAQAQQVLQITPAVMTATLEGLGRRPVSPTSAASRDRSKDVRREQP